MHSIRKLCAGNWTYVWINISLITYIPATTQIRNKSDNVYLLTFRQTYKMELRYNDSLLHLFVKLQIKQEQGDKNAANRAATVLSLILVMYKLLYIRIIHRDWKTLKCGDFYCRAFLSRENHSFIWLTQSRRIVGRHTQSHTQIHTYNTHTYTQTRTLSLSLSLFPSPSLVLTLSLPTFITKHINSMRCWADLIVPFSSSFSMFRAFVCAVLWLLIFLIEKRRTRFWFA